MAQDFGSFINNRNISPEAIGIEAAAKTQAPLAPIDFSALQRGFGQAGNVARLQMALGYKPASPIKNQGNE